MAPRFTVALLSSLILSGPACASAAAAEEQNPDPRPGILLSGSIQFPRPQTMSIQTDRRNGSPLTISMGFDGRCRGGRIGEAWASRVPTRQDVPVKDGRFSATLNGTVRNLGRVEGRTGEFHWRITGRFLERDVATATVSGTADIRVGGRVVSRCKIAEPTTVRLAVRST